MYSSVTAKTRIMVVLDTRHEAFQAAPIIERLRHRKSIFETILVAISHSRDPLTPVLSPFQLTPDIVLDLTHIRQGLPSLTCHVLESMTVSLEKIRPDLLLTQGYSPATFAASLAAFHLHIPVGYMAWNVKSAPTGETSPENINQRLTAVMADMHFTSTRFARQQLVTEGIPQQKIYVTGNPLIEAIKRMSTPLLVFPSEKMERAAMNGKRFVLFAIRQDTPAGPSVQTMLQAITELQNKTFNTDIIVALMAEDATNAELAAVLAGRDGLHLISSPDEMTFCNLLRQAHLVITDSESIPQEASVFQKPVLLVKHPGTRQSGIYTVATKAVEDASTLANEAAFLLNNAGAYRKMQDTENPYGDGLAAERVVTALERWANHRQPLLAPAEEFYPKNPIYDFLSQKL